MVVVVCVIDLHFVASVHRHPRLGGLLRDADEDARVRVISRRFEDYTDDSVADFLRGVPQEAHPAMRLQKALFDLKSSRTDVLPTCHVFAVEE